MTRNRKVLITISYRKKTIINKTAQPPHKGMSREVVPGAQPCTMDVSSGSPCARLVRATGLHKATAQGSAQGFTQAPGLNASGPTMNTNAQCYGDIIADSYRHQRSNRSTQPHTRPCTSAHKHPHKQRVNGRTPAEPHFACL